MDKFSGDHCDELSSPTPNHPYLQRCITKSSIHGPDLSAVAKTTSYRNGHVLRTARERGARFRSIRNFMTARRHRPFLFLLWLGFIDRRAIGAGERTNEPPLRRREHDTTSFRELGIARVSCEERHDEGRCETDARGSADLECLWVGFACITLPLGRQGPPSVAPMALPASVPTKRPTTSSPTKKSTPSPTKSPSRRPPDAWTTEEPSPEPSPGPTAAPAARASAVGHSYSDYSRPTAKPGEPPSAEPTSSPTGQPTSRQDESATKSPLAASGSPSASPSGLPLTSPIHSPTHYEVSSAMTLYGAGELDGDAMEIWIEETRDRIHGEALVIVEDGAERFNVTLQIDKQKATKDGRILKSSNATASLFGASIENETPNRQKVETSRLRIEFTTIIKFTSQEDDWNPSEMVAAGFVTVYQREEYLYALQAADGAFFGSVGGMSIEVDGTLIDSNLDYAASMPERRDPNTSSPVKSKDTIHYMIGGAAGGLLLLLLAGGIGAMYYKQKSSSPPPKSLPEDVQAGKFGGVYSAPPRGGFHAHPNATTVASTVTSTTTSQTFGKIGAIQSEGMDDDVSALRDPYLGEDADSQRLHADVTVGESTAMSSGRRLYEYGVRRSGRADSVTTVTGGSSSNAASSRDRSAFADDATFEDFYRTPDGSCREDGCSAYRSLTVVAPLGKLGIIIDNPTGDVPVVHAIKETSSLRGRARVGDLLVSVDEVDCRGLSAAQVGRLISDRSCNPERVLVLMRGPLTNCSGRC